MSKRKWKNGDDMFASEIQMIPNPTWATPTLVIFSQCMDSRDGSKYIPRGLEPDRVTAPEILQRGIWTQEEAGLVIGLLTKLYERIGDL